MAGTCQNLNPVRQPVPSPAPRHRAPGKRIAFIILQVLLPYVLVETLVTAYCRVTRMDGTYFVMEDTGRSITFDPIRGYRLSPTPSRCVRFIQGKVENVGVFRGNAQGFAYRSDFGPKRCTAGGHAGERAAAGRRFAVFGDSFTHAPFLSQSWPERAEDLLHDRGEDAAFLNFGQWGAGLANWWSITTRFLDAEDYELDGVIFAAFEGDLRRRFTVFAFPEPRTPHQPALFGRWPSWDPKTYPRTLAQARHIVDEGQDYHTLSYEEFERALHGEWPAGVPRPFHLAFYNSVKTYIKARTAKPGTVEEWHGFGEREPLIADIRAYLQKRRLPALVLFIPLKDSVLAPSQPYSIHREETRHFAEALGAAFVDAGEDFATVPLPERRSLFFPHDPHWNQKGSNRFAELVLAKLSRLAAHRADSLSKIAHQPDAPAKGRLLDRDLQNRWDELGDEMYSTP